MMKGGAGHATCPAMLGLSMLILQKPTIRPGMVLASSTGVHACWAQEVTQAPGRAPHAWMQMSHTNSLPRAPKVSTMPIFPYLRTWTVHLPQ